MFCLLSLVCFSCRARFVRVCPRHGPFVCSQLLALWLCARIRVSISSLVFFMDLLVRSNFRRSILKNQRSILGWHSRFVCFLASPSCIRIRLPLLVFLVARVHVCFLCFGARLTCFTNFSVSSYARQVLHLSKSLGFFLCICVACAI